MGGRRWCSWCLGGGGGVGGGGGGSRLRLGRVCGGLCGLYVHTANKNTLNLDLHLDLQGPDAKVQGIYVP